MMISGNNRPMSSTSSIGCLLVGGLMIFGFFYFTSWLYFKLWYAVPVFVLISLVVNRRVITGVFARLWDQFQVNPALAIIRTAILGVMLPFVSIGWVLGALGLNQVQKMQQDFGKKWGFGAFDPSQVSGQNVTEYAEFEEIETLRPKADPSADASDEQDYERRR